MWRIRFFIWGLKHTKHEKKCSLWSVWNNNPSSHELPWEPSSNSPSVGNNRTRCVSSYLPSTQPQQRLRLEKYRFLRSMGTRYQRDKSVKRMSFALEAINALWVKSKHLFHWDTENLCTFLTPKPYRTEKFWVQRETSLKKWLLEQRGRETHLLERC